MKKKVSFFLMLFLVISTVLCACSGGTKNENENPTPADGISSLGAPTYGGSVIVGITQDLDSLDPHKAVAAGTKEVLFNIFEGLVKPDKDGNLVPAVASGYIISDDGTRYTFTLRKGVKFHDGALVTADDVIYSLKRSAGLLEVPDPGVVVDTALSCIDSIDHVITEDGDDEILLTLNASNTELIGYLTCSIIPKDYEEQGSAPIGTGPFRFVSYSPLQNLIVEKNNDYYLEGMPYLDGVTFKISANTDAAFLELLSGAIDIFPYLTIEQANQLEASYNVLTGDMNLVQALFLNNDTTPFDNILVRQALFYGIDAPKILEMVGGSGGNVIRSSMFHGFAKYYNSELDSSYAYNAEKAKQLLSDAGYPNGFEFTIKVPSNYQYHVDTAQVIVEQLKQIGVTAKIQLVEWATWLSDVYKARDYEATITGLVSKLAPSDMLKRYLINASNNFINYKNDDYDKTYEEAYRATDEVEKITLYKELQRILNEDAASIYIQDPPLLVAVNKKLGGYTYYPVYVQDMSVVYYAK